MTDILDVRVLDDLAQDLGDLAAYRLAVQYGDGLEQRLELLAAAASDGNVWAVYDTAVDLATVSAMVGADALARAVWAVARDITRYRRLPRTETLDGLLRLVRDTEAALVRHRARLRRPRTDTPAHGPYG
ncbi:hypothetical protein [Promicromonospora panici]|uniref:hypothetical protein n=1 Tax=Promicromonospora panici TaxID=2219658 RepID=UPI00101D1580|nr:hypothetical protein [Promicromonospora panici]